MGNIDLAALEIFKTVAEQGGITKAAVRLHRVQSNVTTRVKQLEERLGARLFLRHRRRLVLSPEGTLLLEYADRLLRLSSEAEAALQNGVPRGLLRMGALESVAATRLPPILSRYHRSYPDVRIELMTGTTDDLETLPAFVEELVLITPQGFRPIRAPKDIGHTTLIAFANGCSYRRRLEGWLGSAGVVPEHVMEFASYHAIVACVAAGTGIAVVPRSIVRVARVKGEIAVLPLPLAVSKARTSLVWRRGHQSVALDAMKQEIERGDRRPAGRGGKRANPERLRA